MEPKLILSKTEPVIGKRSPAVVRTLVNARGAVGAAEQQDLLRRHRKNQMEIMFVGAISAAMINGYDVLDCSRPVVRDRQACTEVESDQLHRAADIGVNEQDEEQYIAITTSVMLDTDERPLEIDASYCCVTKRHGHTEHGQLVRYCGRDAESGRGLFADADTWAECSTQGDGLMAQLSPLIHPTTQDVS
ncbi:hypothetical protein K5D56_25435 [Pseudomonas cichorii]|nr:hypothetical protein [Pseudomonas cichorii]MBX8557006.1 hypothetical protein [Pseudomonas cichorii]MBX8592719.1 hypothetical protein [Pseudomonas cichorii]